MFKGYEVNMTGRVVVAAVAAAVVGVLVAWFALSEPSADPAASIEPTVPATTGPPATTPVTTVDTTEASSLLLLPGKLQHLADVWPTDWANATIDLDELSVGLRLRDPRDGIPPIDAPVFETVARADEWLDGREPGLLLELEGEARYYPIRIMTLHEIVNDEIGGIPIAVTYCPLCNSGVIFRREVEGEVLRFGVSGLLRQSDLVMWDDATTSLWQQITGEAIVGDHAGRRLEGVASSLVRWEDFKSTFPDGVVLSRETGIFTVGSYGINTYEGYSSRGQPFGSFIQGEIDDRFPALERVVGVNIGDSAKAYPFSVISEERTVNDVVDGVPIVVFWGAEDTADPLDSEVIILGQAIGTGVAYHRTVGGQELTFTAVDDVTFTDEQTGTTWNILGKALEGPLAGESLEVAIHRNEFWFAWQAFFPEAPVHGG